MLSVGRTGLVQLVCWTNSPRESFEVTKWYDPSKIVNQEQINNELLAISNKLYSAIIEQHGRKAPKNKMTAIGMSSQVLDVKKSEEKDITNRVHYAWYEGRCLDPKRLSYFIPKKILIEGNMTIEEIRNL